MPKKCPDCKSECEVRLSGPAAKRPDFPYWVCPNCVGDKGPKFVSYGTCEDYPAANKWKKGASSNSFKDEQEASKKRKRQDSDEEEDSERLMKRSIDYLKARVDYIIELMEKNWVEKDWGKEEEKFQSVSGK